MCCVFLVYVAGYPLIANHVTSHPFPLYGLQTTTVHGMQGLLLGTYLMNDQYGTPTSLNRRHRQHTATLLRQCLDHRPGLASQISHPTTTQPEGLGSSP